MEILEALPKWFEIPESRVSYAKESRELPFFADVENDVARGFIVMKETSHYTVEICVMGVREGMYPDYDLTNAFYQKVGFRELVDCLQRENQQLKELLQQADIDYSSALKLFRDYKIKIPLLT